jgi:nitrilase
MVERTDASGKTTTVAVVQAAPVLFDADATLARVGDWVRQAADADAELVLFPEAFVSGYPRGLSFGTVVGHRRSHGRDLWHRYWASAIDVPGPVTQALGELAADAGVYLAIGVIERDTQFGGGTLYCSLLTFGPTGKLLGIHRKLKPTGSERLIWGEGDGSGLIVLETRLGRVGGLICWENYMPLARMALYGQGVEIYLAPTADARETWQATLRHIACEGRCFVLSSNQYVTREMYPDDLPGLEELVDSPEVMCRGGSAIISPLGEVLAGPLYDREGLLVVELDPDAIARSRFDFDVVGHYARPDVFRFSVNRRTNHPVRFDDGDDR